MRAVEKYNLNGIPVTDLTLRLILLDKLVEKGTDDIQSKVVDLSDNAGKDQLKFGPSWAHRFWKRNKISSRKPTTKMRDELPEDYDTKKEKYLLLLSSTIRKYNVPNILIVSTDETNTQFVPTIKRDEYRTEREKFEWLESDMRSLKLL